MIQSVDAHAVPIVKGRPIPSSSPTPSTNLYTPSTISPIYSPPHSHHQHHQHPPHPPNPPSPPINTPSYNSAPLSNYFDSGVQQSDRYRDVFFLLLFLAMVVGDITFTVMNWEEFSALFSGYNYNNADNGDEVWSMKYLYLISVSIVTSISLSLLSLTIMLTHPETLIKTSLIFSISLCFTISMLSLLDGIYFAFFIFLLMGLLTLWYFKSIYFLIPFASTNLITGVTSIKANMSVLLVCLLGMVVNGIAGVWWVGVCRVVLGGYQGEEDEMPTAILFFLLLQIYWWLNISTNIIHVTVSGVVGTWWFTPSAHSSVSSSFRRATTWSLGSICFGSLIVAVVQAIRGVVQQARQSDDGLLACLADCLLSCIESLAQYFNRWAFIYVGLYGYSFIESGSAVMTLFKHRGITTIVTDDLIGSVCMFVSAGIGVLTGLAAVVLILVYPGSFGDDSSSTNFKVIAFIVGFVLGLTISSVLLSVINSSVDATIVLFAEAPADFHRNHRLLSDKMNVAWVKIFPSWFYGSSYDGGSGRV